MKCVYCGSEQFIGHQLVRMDVLVDSDGNFIGDMPEGLSIYDAEDPYSPFHCCGCGAEYDELNNEAKPISGPVKDWTPIMDEAKPERTSDHPSDCFECDAECCAYNPDGICKFALVYGREPVLHDDGCDDFCYKEA